MAQVSRTRTLSAEPATVWALLADFGDLAGWAAGVDHCCLLNHVEAKPPLGLSRRVQMGRDTVVETITDTARPTSSNTRSPAYPRGCRCPTAGTCCPTTGLGPAREARSR